MFRTPNTYICETGVRDELQRVCSVVPTPIKAALIDELAASGISEIDGTSVVPPQVSPQFSDAALGGLGGCPFVPSASDDIASEDLVFTGEQIGPRTGIDLQMLIKATNSLTHRLPQERMRSHVREAGIPRVYKTAA